MESGNVCVCATVSTMEVALSEALMPLTASSFLSDVAVVSQKGAPLFASLQLDIQSVIDSFTVHEKGDSGATRIEGGARLEGAAAVQELVTEELEMFPDLFESRDLTFATGVQWRNTLFDVQRWYKDEGLIYGRCQESFSAFGFALMRVEVAQGDTLANMPVLEDTAGVYYVFGLYALPTLAPMVIEAVLGRLLGEVATSSSGPSSGGPSSGRGSPAGKMLPTAPA